MKNQLACIMLLLPFFCAAQNDMIGKEYKWEIAMQMNTLEELPPIVNLTNFFQLSGDKKNSSYSLSLVGSYLLKNHSEIKVKAGITSYSFSLDYQTIQSSVLINESHSELEQKTWAYSVGLAQNFLLDRFLFYGGSDVQIKIFGKYLLNDKTQAYQNDTLFDIAIINHSVDGGIGLGIGFNVGLNYNLFNRLKLGLEFSSSLLYSKIGGNLIERNTAYYPNNVLYYDETFIWQDEIKEFNLRRPQSSFYVKYSF